MKKPVLVIMAAGMGSRYGGLKQIDPIDSEGHIIMDFSIYDAMRAGFEEAVIIIKKENEEDFKACIGDRIKEHMKITYVYQEQKLPDGFEVPEGRVKPFGTGHAILSCLGVVDAPFMVINADDYYGSHAFSIMYDYLCSHGDDERYRYAMVGYILENTLTENGHVARGVCKTDDTGHLKEITERTRIQKVDVNQVKLVLEEDSFVSSAEELEKECVAFSEDDGATWHPLPKDATVSMNMWGFTPSILKELEARFPVFLEENLASNPLKCEFFLPAVVSDLLAEDKAVVDMLKSEDRWYGVTYHEDKQVVMDAVENMKQQGLYPRKLWE